MFDEILVGSLDSSTNRDLMLTKYLPHLITIELRLLITVHCWIRDSILLPGASNLLSNNSIIFLTTMMDQC